MKSSPRLSITTRAVAAVGALALALGLAVGSPPAVASQPSATQPSAVQPAASEPGWEVGRLLTDEPNHPFWDQIVIGRIFLDRTTWTQGSRLTLTTIIDLSHPSFHPESCVHPESGSVYWAGLRWLELSFKDHLTGLSMGDYTAPPTAHGRAPLQSATEGREGVRWRVHGDYFGNVSLNGESLGAGRYSFSFEAPASSDNLDLNRLHENLDASVHLWHMVKGIAEENPTGSSEANCWFATTIREIEPGSLQRHGSTVLKATAKPAAWGSKPSVTATLTSAEGIPTGRVTVTGPRGVKGQGTLARQGATGRAVITLPATLPVGKHRLTVSYAGQGWVSGATATVNLTVAKRKPSAAVKVTKKPTPKKKGKARLTVASPLSTKPTGKVTVTLKKGRASKKVTGKLRRGKVTVTLPKLAKGKWTVIVRYAGDARYAAAKAKAPKIRSR